MRYTITFVVTLLLVPMGARLLAQETTPAQQEIVEAIGRLSAATAPGGGGPDAYAAMLADDFSRWTLGADSLDDKASWIEGVRGWYGDGWRVADRQVAYREIEVRDELAFTRRVVTETYVGPDGERSTSTAALAEVWVRRAGEWKLLRVDVRPVPGS